MRQLGFVSPPECYTDNLCVLRVERLMVQREEGKGDMEMVRRRRQISPTAGKCRSGIGFCSGLVS